jgi:hypothetical protein
MGQPTDPALVLLLLAAFSRHDAAIAWTRRRAVQAWGPVALESAAFPFQETQYYETTMGAGLRKCFFGFAGPVDPAGLADWKLATNAWERQYAETASHAEPRPLNLDPGYIALGKLVLASTKDFAHRIYLGRGIYGEITLYYKGKSWQHHAWTFADYRRPQYQQFFSECREYLHRQLRAAKRSQKRCQEPFPTPDVCGPEKVPDTFSPEERAE